MGQSRVSQTALQNCGQAEPHLSMLWSLTVSGYVRLSAMLQGTPNSSMAMLGSPEMTVRAEKSTRLPMRLPRTLPDLPFRRWLIDMMGRPDLCRHAGAAQ